MSSCKEHLRTNEQTNNQDEINEKIKKDYGKFGEVLEEQKFSLMELKDFRMQKGEKA